MALRLEGLPQEGPNVVLLEEPYVHKGRARSAMIQFMFLHLLERAFSENFSCPVLVVSPRQAKKAATGSGSAGKEAVISKMGKLIPLSLDEYNRQEQEAMCDATAITLCREARAT